MYSHILSVLCIAIFMAINSLAMVVGQSPDSLLYLLNNDLVKDDAEKYDLLCKIIQKTDDADTSIK
jgi:hypothetical protein